MKNQNGQRLGKLNQFIRRRERVGYVIGGCRSQSSKICSWLLENGFSESEVIHKQSYFNGDDGIAEHFYVKVKIDGVWYILDPTVSQFTEKNYIERKADTYVPESEIPEVGVIAPDDTIYNRYE